MFLQQLVYLGAFQIVYFNIHEKHHLILFETLPPILSEPPNARINPSAGTLPAHKTVQGDRTGRPELSSRLAPPVGFEPTTSCGDVRQRARLLFLLTDGRKAIYNTTVEPVVALLLLLHRELGQTLIVLFLTSTLTFDTWVGLLDSPHRAAGGKRRECEYQREED